MSRYKKTKSKRNKFMEPGFTIVELLIVIVVIGILASLTISAYNGIQQRTKYAKVREAIAKVEKAYKMKALQDGFYQPDPYYLTCTGEDPADYSPGINLSIYDAIVSCNDTHPLSNYLKPEEFNVDTEHELLWFYDNDSDAYTHSCTLANRTAGVNIVMSYLGVELAQRLEADIDKNDGSNCGKVRWDVASPHRPLYLLATQSSDGL